MAIYEDLIEKIAAQTGADFRAASVANLSALQPFRLPKSIIDFYARHEPSKYVEGKVRLWPIAEMLVENRDAVPGAYVAPHGFIVFASTRYGDAYCFDLNTVENSEPGIVLISHEVVCEEISAKEARRLAKPVAKNLRDFLEKFVRQEIDEECVY